MEWLLSLLFPPKCILCQRVLRRSERNLCPTCQSSIITRENSKDNLRFISDWYSLWDYQEDVRQSIHRYKFRDRQNYASGYASILATKLAGKWDVDGIAWVPISKKRRRSRGYDQSQLLAQALSRELSLPVVPALDKVVDNKPQSSIGGEAQRRANVLNAYMPNSPEAIKGKKLLLVDDVLTTGATACECAKVLNLAGVEKVYLATVAASTKRK